MVSGWASCLLVLILSGAVVAIVRSILSLTEDRRP